MVIGDLHIHSTFSDGILSIEELVDLYGSRGFGVICISDHLCEQSSFLGVSARVLNRTLTPENFERYLDTIEKQAKRAWKKYSMLVLPGFELTKNFISNYRSAHILAVDVNGFISADGHAESLIHQIHAQDALAIAAHPVNTRKLEKQTYYLWDQRETLQYHFDAWEVASGPHLFPDVVQSSLPKIANSDLHHPKQINSWKTAFFCDRDKEAIKNAIRHQTLGVVKFDVQHCKDLEEIHSIHRLQTIPTSGRDYSLAAARSMIQLT